MRRVFLSTISVLALSVTWASAADIPRAAPAYRAPAVYAPVFTWTGGYIGINAGYGWGSSDWSGFAADADPSGGLVGLTLGYNWQAGPWVFGLEGDIAWSGIKGNFANAVCPFGCEVRNQWLGTARGRLGYAMDRFMPYITGGAAFGDVRTTVNGVANGGDTNVGWTIGAGIEGALAPNWTAKLEYLYVDLGDVSCGALTCGLVAPDFQAHILRVGLNYKF